MGLRGRSGRPPLCSRACGSLHSWAPSAHRSGRSSSVRQSAARHQRSVGRSVGELPRVGGLGRAGRRGAQRLPPSLTRSRVRSGRRSAKTSWLFRASPAEAAPGARPLPHGVDRGRQPEEIHTNGGGGGGWRRSERASAQTRPIFPLSRRTISAVAADFRLSAEITRKIAGITGETGGLT